MALSILHRATGIALSAGFVVLVAWLMVAATGSEAYASYAAVMGSLFGKLLLIGWSFAFFYHLSNGVRHLVWDTGRGFEKSQANSSSWVVLLGAALLTAVFWGLAS